MRTNSRHPFQKRIEAICIVVLVSTLQLQIRGLVISATMSSSRDNRVSSLCTLNEPLRPGVLAFIRTLANN
jgi:hypothetical protein